MFWADRKLLYAGRGVALLSSVLLWFVLYWTALEGFECDSVPCDGLCLM